ncbi:hypothetical protein DFAR_3380009 [Desulfarculales bacterium]
MTTKNLNEELIVLKMLISEFSVPLWLIIY